MAVVHVLGKFSFLGKHFLILERFCLGNVLLFWAIFNQFCMFFPQAGIVFLIIALPLNTLYCMF